MLGPLLPFAYVVVMGPGGGVGPGGFEEVAGAGLVGMIADEFVLRVLKSSTPASHRLYRRSVKRKYLGFLFDLTLVNMVILIQ